MGYLDQGQWTDEERWPKDADGRFQRNTAAFRDWIEPGGRFAPEAGRYHLYLAHACPWCHRTAIVHALKGLADVVSVSFVHPLMREGGWRFDGARYVDPIHGADFAHQLYTRARPDHSGRVTVPVLWDRETDTIVNNESSEIIRMLHALDPLAGDPELDLYPEPLRAEIDALNAVVYEAVNNGVYRCGFAGTQAAYAEAFEALFATLDELEARLEDRRFLVGDRLTEADVRLWVTLIRFDAVYVGHFKCNLRRVADYPSLSRYVRSLYRLPAFAGTTHIEEIKLHYYGSHRSLNPSGIVPVGPELNLEER